MKKLCWMIPAALTVAGAGWIVQGAGKTDKIDTKDLNKPQLRKAPGSGTTSADGTSTAGSDDDRPTLKRRPDGGSN